MSLTPHPSVTTVPHYISSARTDKKGDISDLLAGVGLKNLPFAPLWGSVIYLFRLGDVTLPAPP
jgi:hypothetical protein